MSATEQWFIRLATVDRAAHEYVRAFIATIESYGPNKVDAQLRLDVALHDLVLACGEPCVLCDDGTCPGMFGPLVVDTRPL